MQVQAIWENGVFRPTAPLTLKHRVVTIQIHDDEVLMEGGEFVAAIPPGEALDLPEPVRLRIAARRARRETLLHGPAECPEEDRPPTDKQVRYARASEERNAWRGEQGREP